MQQNFFELTMDEAQVHQIIEANNGVLLTQMSDLISAQVASLKRPAEDSVSIIREIKKIKTADARPVFKKKSNEEQYKASTKVLDTLEDAKYNLESNNLEAAKTAVDQGITLVKERQKLILLADKSQYGWKTVQEYLQHELADDSDDEKKIYRAEARAAKSSKRSAFQRNAPRSTSTVSQAQPVSTATVQSSPIPTIVSRGTTFGQVSRVFGPQRLAAGACFACGKIGHWRASCPLNQQANNGAGQKKQ